MPSFELFRVWKTQCEDFPSAVRQSDIFLFLVHIRAPFKATVEVTLFQHTI